MGSLCSRKSQILAFEAIIAVGIFMSAVVLLSTSVFSKVDERAGKQEMEGVHEAVFYATETLLKTPGYPEDWNSTDYMQLGLESDDLVVSKEKLDNLMLINEQEIVDNLGLSGYNFFLNITSVFNYTESISYEKGTFPLDPYILVPVERIFLLDNITSRIPCRFKIEVWR